MFSKKKSNWWSSPSALRKKDFKEPSNLSDGLQPISDGLQPNHRAGDSPEIEKESHGKPKTLRLKESGVILYLFENM